MNISNALINRLFPAILFVLLIVAESKAQEKTHTIKSGETLSSIAKKYKTTIAELQRLNPETKSGIRAGATLQVGGDSNPKNTEAKETKVASSSESGKTHLVKSGESLSRIAKKYKVSVSDLEKWNGIPASSLKAGVEIAVSEPGSSLSAEETTKETAAMESSNEMPIELLENHVVAKGQTLSLIARQHKTTVAALKKLNGLTTNSVNLGLVLKVPGATKPEPTLAEVKITPKAEEPKPIKEQKPEIRASVQPVAPPVVETVKPTVDEKEIPALDPRANSGSIKEVSNTLGYTRVLETGFAEAIEGEGNSKKHLCLHKSAPVGSILQVKNEANGQSVFVKVIGKLPETGSNEKLIIRISRQAYDKLLAVGKRFPVEVSYPMAQ